MNEGAWIDWRIPGPPAGRYWKRELLLILAVSESTLDHQIAIGRFPQGIRTSPGTEPFWTGQVLAAWFLVAPLLQERERTGAGQPDAKAAPRKKARPAEEDAGEEDG